MLLLLVSGLGAGIASAQSGPGQPGRCGVAPAGGLPALQQRKQRLESKIAMARARKPAGIEVGAKSLTKTQAALLEVVFQIHCLQLQQANADGLRDAEVSMGQAEARAPADQAA